MKCSKLGIDLTLLKQVVDCVTETLDLLPRVPLQRGSGILMFVLPFIHSFIGSLFICQLPTEVSSMPESQGQTKEVVDKVQLSRSSINCH